MAIVAKTEAALKGDMLRAMDAAIGPEPARDKIIEILLQRRLLSIEIFTWMMDRLICAIDDDGARDIAIGILRDEYSGPNHRYEFFMEIVSLGVGKRQVLLSKPSRVTKQVIRKVRSITMRLETATELERIAFLRFFAEITPGHEFSHLLQIMQDNEIIEPNQSRFLRPHVNYDVIGDDKTEPHAEQYNAYMERLLHERNDLDATKAVLHEARDVRVLFYSQFAPVPAAA